MAVHIFTEEWTKGSASKGSIIACNYYLNKRQKRHRDEWWIAQNGMKNLLKEHSNTLFLRDIWKNHGSPKGKCALEGIFFANRFPSLGNFVNKKVGFGKN